MSRATLLRDFRHGIRQIRRSPGFAASTALTLASGIGAAIAVFAVLDAVVLKPLPFADPERLTAVRTVDRDGALLQLSYPNFFDLRERNSVFDHLVSYREAPFTLTGSTPAVPVTGEIVSWDLFALLGTRLARGRGFQPEEEVPGAHAVVLSHALWIERFSGDERIPGGAIQIDGVPFTVVGIAPEGFRFPLDAPGARLWVTRAEDASAAAQRGARMLDVIARLRPGVSFEQAQADMDVLARALAREHPDANGRMTGAFVQPEQQRMTGEGARGVWALAAAVLLLLLIACANVAGLLLARSTERSREFAVRMALGASRGALVRQSLVESLALGLIGTGGGVLMAMGALRLVLPLAGDRFPRLTAAAVDARVLLFSALLALATTMVFGLAPALQASSADPAGALKQGARGIAGRHDRFRGTLVVAQIALGLVLLAGADLLMVTFASVVRGDPGFRSDHLLTFDVGVPGAEYGTAAQVALNDRLLERMRAIPGVQGAAAGTPLPLQGHEMRAAFDVEGRPTAAADRPRADFAIVTPGYFRTIGIALVKGRDFTDRDDGAAPLVLVVNQAFARKHFPNEEAIGKRIRSGAGPVGAVREIIGVVGDAKQVVFGAEVDPIYYFPYKQLPWRIGSVVLRTAVPPLTVEGAVRTAVSGIDPQLAVRQVRTGDTLSSAVIAPARFLTAVVSAFAAIALVLTVAGLYGVLSYLVARRRREIGIRIALGAGRADVIRMVLRRAAVLVVPGLVLGSAAAFAVTRLLGFIVFDARVGAPAIVAGACVLMLAAGSAAALLPARRAASVDPMNALRTE
jgi:putative ABC transport system permease protein